MRVRRSNSVVPIILILLILGGMALITIKYYEFKNSWLGHFLTEEFVPENVVTRGVFSIDYGKVYEVKATKTGWEIQESNKAVYEKMTLSGVDLALGDVIAPKIWDWYFDGVDDYIDVPHSSYLAPTDLSVEIRVKWLGSSYGLLFKGIGGALHFLSYAIYYSDTLCMLALGNGTKDCSFFKSMGVSKPYEWTSLAFTYKNGTEIKVYQDGSLYQTYTTDIEYMKDTYSLLIGCFRWANELKWFFKGKVSHVILYGRVLSDAEVSLCSEHVLSADSLNLFMDASFYNGTHFIDCLLYTSPSPRDLSTSRMPSSA